MEVQVCVVGCAVEWGAFFVKWHFLMSYLDKLYFKVPVTIYHTLWVIRL